MPEDLSKFRFQAGVMRGLLISSATDDYLAETLAAIPAGTTTARACRAEIARREREEKPRFANFNPYAPPIKGTK